MANYNKRDVLEKVIEGRFVEHVKACGCWCIKLNPLGFRGLPDRLCIGPYRFILFVELKQRLGRKTAVQIWVHEKLQEFGFEVMVPYDINEAITDFNIALTDHIGKRKRG